MMPGPDLGKLVENLTAYARAGVDSPRQGWGSLVRAGGAVTLALLVVMSAVAMPVFGQAQIGGEVQITGDPATDGSTYSYPLSDPDVASDPVFNLTGKESMEEIHKSTTLADGGNDSITVTGNADADLNITFVGTSGNLSDETADKAISVSDNSVSSKTIYTSPRSATHVLEFDWTTHVYPDSNYKDFATDVGVYDSSEGNTDWTYLDGGTVSDDNSYYGNKNITFDLDESDEIRIQANAKDDGVAVELQADASPIWYPYEKSGTVDWDIEGDSYTTNDLADGESWEKHLNVSPGDHIISATTSTGGGVDLLVNGNERTVTQDPGVELNNETASYSGTLAEGETTQLTLPASALVEGTNTINVSMPGLSADAPPMQVGLEYSHTAASNVSVSSISGQWQSQYTLNKTFPDARSNATARLAFPDEVVSFKSVDVSRDGGSYETLPTSQWTTDETDLVAELGDVATNETVSVKATAQKVRTENGEIVVLEPTPPGSALSSKVEVASRSEGFHIRTNTTKLLTASSPSYDGEDAYSIVDQTGQEFYLPNAQNQSTFTAEHVGLEADPVTGDVLVDLESTSAPLRFRVEAGETGGDQVDYRYLDASSGLEYTLYSLTYDEPRASAASGGEPVVLRDDDTGETLQISSATSSGGTLESSDSILEIVFDVLRSGGIVAIAGGSIVALFFAGSRVGTEDGTLDEDQTGLGLSLIGLLVALPITLEVLSPGAISSRIGAAVSGVIETALGPVLVIGVGGLIFLVYTFLQTKEKKAPTLIFRGGKKP